MLTLIITGLLVGLISSFFGVGGGVVIVPALYFLYPGLPAQTIISSSLGVIFFNGLLNTFNFIKLGKKPRLPLVLPLAIAMAIGSLIGAHYSLSIPQDYLRKGFSLLLFIAATKTLFAPNQPPEQSLDLDYNLKRFLFTAFLGLMAGTIAGLTGVGGGIVIVPALITLYHMPMSLIPAYSNPAMSACTLFGLIPFLMASAEGPIQLPSPLDATQMGYLNPGIIGILVFSSFISSRLGAKLTDKIDQKKAKKAFAILIYLSALRLFFK